MQAFQVWCAPPANCHGVARLLGTDPGQLGCSQHKRSPIMCLFFQTAPLLDSKLICFIY